MLRFLNTVQSAERRARQRKAEARPSEPNLVISAQDDGRQLH
jgi:hypothetical protein